MKLKNLTKSTWGRGTIVAVIFFLVFVGLVTIPEKWILFVIVWVMILAVPVGVGLDWIVNGGDE